MEKNVKMNYYRKVLRVCEKYLGSGAKPFLDRQLKLHLYKKPNELTSKDGNFLAKWCEFTGNLLIGEKRGKELAKDILAIR